EQGPAAPKSWLLLPTTLALHGSLDAVSQAQGRPGHPDAPPNIYEGGLGSPQPQCPSAQGSKPKNFRLCHLRGLGLYLESHPPPTGQCESHWLGRLMAGGCLPQPEGTAWALDLPQGTLGPRNSLCSALLEARLPRDSLGSSASSSSMDPDKGALRQPSPSRLRPKRSWGTWEEAMCPLCKRTRSGALERP
ncbi:C16orf90 isoform 1, partial [Pan troglodytes]